MTKFIGCCILVLGVVLGIIVGVTHGVQEGVITGVLLWLCFGGIESAYIVYTNRIRK